MPPRPTIPILKLVSALASRFLALLPALLIVTLATTSYSQVVVQEYYVALPEAQIRQNFLTLASNTGTTFDSVISVTVGNSGTRIIYDHWEDGYEIDLNNPTQASTRIWGDGDNANGTPPDLANDPSGLTAGAVLALRNLVTLPRNASTILYDGRDRIGATNAIVVSRSAWATTPGSVLADATEMYPTVDWGTSFISPIGEDVIYPAPLTSSMFEKVSLFVQAVETGTRVQIDANADSVTDTTVILNKGEVHFTASGILKGATVTTNKPVQIHLMTGDVGANYESRWFSVPPTRQWGIRYNVAVGTASNGHEAFAFLYNPNAAPLTVKATTRTGSTSFSIPARNTYQYLMPQNSGVDFDSILDEPFFGIVTVGAKPSSNNVYDWGFSLVPQNNLTTALVVGWGPGSSDLSQNGSPVWITAVADTRLYVDYNGDRNGTLTDPTGQKCDALYDIAALESLRLYDPDKDQTAMRIYTLDGTLITGAWGQDPAVAGAGNPFLDVGTTVPAFPAPVMTKTSRLFTDNATPGLSVGDVVEYTVRLDNKSLVSITSVPVLDTLPSGVSYILNSTTKDGTAVPDAGVTPFPVDEGGLTVPIVRSREFTEIIFLVTITASGTLINTADVLGYPGVTATNTIHVPGSSGFNNCALQFTTSGGVATDYQAGTGIYVTLTDADANTDSGTAESIHIAVTNTSNGDAEFLVLTETGNNTGIFRNTAPLPSSATAGLDPDDSTLHVQPGHALSSQYLDPQFGDACSDSASITAPSLIKQLYLDTDGADDDLSGDLDRISPTATGDLSTSASQWLNTGNTATFTQTPAFVSNFAMPAGGTITGRAWVEVPSGSLPAGTAITGTLSRNGTPFATLSTPTTTLLSGGVDTVSVGATSSAQNTSTNSLSFSHTVAAGDNRLLLVSIALGATTQTGNPPNVSSVTYNGTGMTLVGSRRSGSGSDVNDDTTSFIYRLTAPPVGTANVVVSLNAAGGIAAGATTFYNVNQTTPLGAFASQGGYGIAPSVTLSSAAGEVVFGTVSADEAPTLAPGTGIVSRWLRNAYGFTSGGTGTATGAASVTFAYTSNDNSQDWAIAAVPVRPSFTTALYQLDWTTTLATATTVATGQTISLAILNNVAGTPLRLLYDSQTYPSKIDLPTDTVIDTLSVSVSDEPFPAGGTVTSAAIGETAFVRIAVTDPFGTYDITSVDLTIDGPGSGGDVTTTLAQPSVISDNGTVKIYEYPWVTTATEGNYSISVVSKEGLENTITSPKATSFTLTQLDLGTPGTTEFNKEIYSPNETVCITATDLDQNLNPAAAETVPAVVTTSGGDSELIILTETGPNTGIFSACIPASAATPGSSNNGTLYVPVSAVLNVVYVDPDDSSDTSGDTASVPTAGPSLSVVKTLLTPADGQVVSGEPVQYRVQVTNTGGTTLSTISLTDSFPATNLGYVDAVAAPDTTGPGSLIWNNVGPLSPGQSTDIIVNFTALASANPAVNSALADAGSGITASDTENIVITNPSLTLTKTLVSPNPGPAGKGDDVVFQITVQNTGDTAITSLPLEDTYSGSFFEFVSATPAADGVGNGSLLWNDLTGAGSLAPNDSLVLSVTLRALGAADLTPNNAAALYATDVNGDPVPPSDSTATIQTLAATISGTVFEDSDDDDIFSPGDDPLQGITVRLFTDPNGDGNPSDGTLVAITSTQADGSYEFLNLETGPYVVVQEDFIGYVSLDDSQDAPTDNQVAVNAATFTEFAGNDFLDAYLDTSTYGSITGQVRNDNDADGDPADPDFGISSVTVDLYTDPNADGNFADGVLLISTVTSASGNYDFPLVPPGSYVLVETDSTGFVSTADTANPNDNRIPVTLAPSSNRTGNDFLDTDNLAVLGTVGNQVWIDTDNNGLFDGGESGVNGVAVHLYRSSQTPGVDTPYLDTTTSGGGLYQFANVPAGDWLIYLPASNFSGVLANALSSSTVTNTGDDAVDHDDNGSQTSPGTGVSSPVFNLTAGESENSKDFGFIPDSSLGSISGSVQSDTNNNDLGDTPLEFVLLTLKDSAGNTVATTSTDASGIYSFGSLPPGSYTIEQDHPPGYASVSDADGGDPDLIGDVTPILLTVGASITGQHFVEVQFGAIRGSVQADLSGDDIPDSLLPNVTITLKDSNGVPITSTTTAGTGIYEFLDLLPGVYTIEQTQPATYSSLSDIDGGDLNIIGDVTSVLLAAGQELNNQNFIEALNGSISGTVTQDVNNDNTGDLPLPGVTMTLLDGNGDPVSSITTDSDGQFTFGDLPPGDYTVVQVDPAGYQSVTPNILPAPVLAGQSTTADFIDEQLGELTGCVHEDLDGDGDGDQPIAGVTLTLQDELGAAVATTVTDAFGLYRFANVPPGSYLLVQTQPAGFHTTQDADVTADAPASPADPANSDPLDNLIPVTLAAGETDDGNDFVEFRPATLSGFVLADTNNDLTGDVPLAGVTLTLQDSDGNAITSTTTDAAGYYAFTGLPPGSYRVAQTQPPGYTSVADTDGGDLDQIGDVTLVTLAPGGTSADHTFVERTGPSHIYNAITGELVAGGSVSLSGPGPVLLVQDGSTGSYAFMLDPANAVAGTYTLTLTPPAGFVLDPTRPVAGPAYDPTAGPNPASLGAPASAGVLTDFSAPANPYYLTFELAPGDPVVLHNNLPLVPAKATTWPAWQYLNNLGGSNAPADNPDNDRYDNLQEFAFCFDPATGLKPRCPVSIQVDPVTGRADLRVLRVTGIAGVTYTLETLTSLDASPAGWNDVTTLIPVVTYNTDGTEWATYQDVAALAPASPSSFFRVRLDLDTDLNGTPEATSRTETAGVFRRTFATQCETFSLPFLQCDLFGGAIDAVIGSVLSIPASIGSADFAAALSAGTHYYVEVLDGDYEGHRFEVNEALSTANGIAVDLASPRTTLASLPADLAGDLIAVRAHPSLNAVFNPALLTATNDPATADRLQFHQGSAFSTYWLFANSGSPRWVLAGDATLADAGSRVLDAGEGLFVRLKSTAATFTFSGLVRSNDFARPLAAGSNFIGGGWPLEQSPASRAMTTANGFDGSNNPAVADKLQIWRGDASANVSGYEGYFLLHSGPLSQWSPEANASLSNENTTTLLRALRAAFILSRNGQADYLMPNPWTP
jgi:uncharacterized repeat protein (TIGR01451 family)